MKTILLLPLFAVGTVMAGDPAPATEKSPIMPPPAETLCDWFVGGSVGYLVDNEEAFGAVQVGWNLDGQLGGFDQAVYLEIAYTELSERRYFGRANGRKYEIEIIPVTLNYKLQRPITEKLDWYLGAGAGVAFIDATSREVRKRSDDDTVFYGQLFTGLVYNVNPCWEIFAGARYIYFDEPSFDGTGRRGRDNDWDDFSRFGYGFENDDFGVELGARYCF